MTPSTSDGNPPHLEGGVLSPGADGEVLEEVNG